ncbi:MAG: TetR/AcrR family transcriptional regulator [Hyphomonadaceae bacterium JAD_PAG50586_4]|nr:MAG: TetR/AcrR family transcriptional regulator [Hyphomonadaceae bacterium JAD_PAG50586_4]
MARTQAPEYDERKLAIVETAAALFARDGFNGASVADIAKRGKISKSLIYHYYTAKEDILYDVMISHVRELEAAAEEIASDETSAETKLRDLTHRFMALYVGAADRHKVLLNDLDNVPKNKRAEIISVQRGLIETVRQLLVEIEPALSKSRALPSPPPCSFWRHQLDPHLVQSRRRGERRHNGGAGGGFDAGWLGESGG